MSTTERIEALEAENARLREESKAERLVLKALLEGARTEKERLEAGLWELATSFYKGDQYQNYARHVLNARRAREGGNADD